MKRLRAFLSATLVLFLLAPFFSIVKAESVSWKGYDAYREFMGSLIKEQDDWGSVYWKPPKWMSGNKAYKRYSRKQSWSLCALADFNCDGIPELILGDYTWDDYDKCFYDAFTIKNGRVSYAKCGSAAKLALYWDTKHSEYVFMEIVDWKDKNQPNLYQAKSVHKIKASNFASVRRFEMRKSANLTPDTKYYTRKGRVSKAAYESAVAAFDNRFELVHSYGGDEAYGSFYYLKGKPVANFDSVAQKYQKLVNNGNTPR